MLCRCSVYGCAVLAGCDTSHWARPENVTCLFLVHTQVNSVHMHMLACVHAHTHTHSFTDSLIL